MQLHHEAAAAAAPRWRQIPVAQAAQHHRKGDKTDEERDDEGDEGDEVAVEDDLLRLDLGGHDLVDADLLVVARQVVKVGINSPDDRLRLDDGVGGLVHDMDVHVGHVPPEAVRGAHVVANVVDDDDVAGDVAQLADDVLLGLGVAEKIQN